MSAPALSVLLPVHDGERYLRAAIESVLAQSFADFELIVLDDGSSDASREIALAARDERVRVVTSGERRGLVETLNQGLALARGELVARQDADDVSHPERFERQLRFLREHPTVALVGSEAAVIDEDGHGLRRLLLPREHLSLRWFHLFDNGFVHSSVVFRTAVVRDELGGYALPHCEDFDLWSRLMSRTDAANLPEVLVRRRVHRGSVLRSLDRAGAILAHSGNERVIAQNLRAVFGESRSETMDAATAARLRTGVPPALLPAFQAQYRRMLAEFERLFPQVRQRADFRRTLALQHAWLARGLLRAGSPRALGPAADSLAADWRVLPRLTAQAAAFFLPKTKATW